LKTSAFSLNELLAELHISQLCKPTKYIY